MSENAECDYAEYHDLLRWDSLVDFCRGPWLTGIHVIALKGGRHLDVQVGGDLSQQSRTRALPVFFSGAVVPRAGKVGPFFSGSGIAERLSTPFLAFSDPLVDASPDLPLGWYAGAAGEGLQEAISDILLAARDRFEELLLVGGSGGGYASILFGDRVGASALVWNPQTDMLKYAPPIVRQYLVASRALDAESHDSDNYQVRSTALTSAAIQHLVTTPRGPGLRRLAYLQNASDWHVNVHAKPFIEARNLTYRRGGVWSDDSSTGLLLVNFSNGHTPPPYNAILRAVEKLLDSDASPCEVLSELQAEGLLPEVEDRIAPKDLLAETDAIAANLSLIKIDRPDPVVTLSWGDLPRGYGGITPVFRADEHALSPSVDDPFQADVSADSSAKSFSATLRDGLGQELLTLRTPQ